jgi:hypothetical protein
MASAQMDDLTGGVFITHHDPAIVASVPPEGYCAHYEEGYAITTCEEQNPMIMTDAPVVWFLLSAFPGDKMWCGTEFGFGQYDPYLFIFTLAGPCAPGGFLEIPTEGWPGPMEGTAIVTTDTPWEGNFKPVYFFEGYYYYYGPGMIPVDVSPSTGVGGWGNCLTPPEVFDAACFPAMGVMGDGMYCCPEIPTGACCVGEDCYEVSEMDCAVMGGEFLGVGTDCGPPNPCEEPRGACCVGEECYAPVTLAECEAMMGEYLGDGTDCGPPNPCEYERFVCCICEDCFIYTEDECMNAGGEWHPEWDTCDPNPCTPSPTDNASWGTIKSIYR